MRGEGEKKRLAIIGVAKRVMKAVAKRAATAVTSKPTAVIELVMVETAVCTVANTCAQGSTEWPVSNTTKLAITRLQILASDGATIATSNATIINKVCRAFFTASSFKKTWQSNPSNHQLLMTNNQTARSPYSIRSASQCRRHYQRHK